MNENNDESKFKKAYRDKVNFKTFSETDSDKYVNSRFSLLRELATEATPKVSDIKTAASVRELLSVKPQEPEKPSKVNLSSVALQTNRTSSLKSFLVQNTEPDYQNNKFSPLTDEPAPVKKTAPKKEVIINENIRNKSNVDLRASGKTERAERRTVQSQISAFDQSA